MINIHTRTRSGINRIAPGANITLQLRLGRYLLGVGWFEAMSGPTAGFARHYHRFCPYASVEFHLRPFCVGVARLPRWLDKRAPAW